MRELYEPQAILPDGIEVTKPAASRRSLERAATDGDSPVGESGLDFERSSLVPRNTWNSVGSRGDHPARLNTPGDR
jgi:hypothetical protein